jgi:hypothetical protein
MKMFTNLSAKGRHPITDPVLKVAALATAENWFGKVGAFLRRQLVPAQWNTYTISQY